MSLDALDCMLTGDEEIVDELWEYYGPMVADQYVEDINNTLLAMSGFEEVLCDVRKNYDVFYVPINHTSIAYH